MPKASKVARWPEAISHRQKSTVIVKRQHPSSKVAPVAEGLVGGVDPEQAPVVELDGVYETLRCRVKLLRAADQAPISNPAKPCKLGGEQ